MEIVKEKYCTRSTSKPVQKQIAKDKQGKIRQRRFRQKWKDDKKYIEKNIGKCAEYRRRLKEKHKCDEDFQQKQKEKERKRKKPQSSISAKEKRRTSGKKSYRK